METTPACESDASGMEKRRRVRKPPKLPKYILPNRDNLDGRTHAARAFDKLYAAISSDLGNDLTAVEQALVEGFCGATVVLQALNTSLALGKASILPSTPPSAAAWCGSLPRLAFPGARASSAA